ncbi:MAG: peptidoglycan recognition protein family protein [Chloroflexaceae bacterium]|jgi:hypothetical protein|nr:peptidoglycan recognition protein family protein [Chloroflexaceae bacterium]
MPSQIISRSAHSFLLVCCVLALVWSSWFAVGATLAQQASPALPQGTWKLDSVVDWQGGQRQGLIVINNAGGELRLDEEQLEGSFLTPPFQATTPFNAAGATWRAELPQGTGLTLELRERSTPISPTVELASDDGWGPWQRLAAGDARSQADDGAFASPDVLLFPKGSRFLQLRASFSSSIPRASAVLSNLNISYFDSTAGVPATAGLPRTPIVFGPDTLTPRPALVLRSTWSGRTSPARPEQATPRGIIVHQIGKLAGIGDAASMLRALTAYQTDVLGWEDLAYHYVIDENGLLYEGRLGGPASFVPRMSGGDTAVHVAVLGDPASAPGDATRTTLASLLAWLGQAYNIAPTGQHTVVLGQERAQRPNIAGHAEVAPEATDPAKPLADLLPQLRTRADGATVRARWYFAEGNLRDFSQRLSFFNPTTAPVSATVTLYRPESTPPTPVVRLVNVPAGNRADLVLADLVSNDTLTATPSLPAKVESSAPIIVERSMSLTGDLDSAPGLTQLSRTWYFAEGSTDGNFRTFLVLFNPQNLAASVTLSYVKGDGTVTNQQVQVPAQQRLVVNVGDTLPGVGFGVRVISSQPIAAERTMRFGPNQSGLHIGRGVVELSNRWYFAEGTTENGFQMRVLLLNPSNQTANATVIFLKADGTKEVRRFALPANWRQVVNANDVVPDQGVATLVESDRPLAVERALYFRDGAAGTVSAGATAPAFTWRFADGRSQDSTYFLTLNNPNTRPAVVTVDFVFGDGQVGKQEISIPANARYTMAVHQIYPDETSIVATVRSTQQIVAERSIFPGGGERGGSTALGVPGE